jgi:hypothetical protein
MRSPFQMKIRETRPDHKSDKEIARQMAIYAAISNWWGKKDSNLRSHKTADLQSAPFATRDTPPLNSIASPRRNGSRQAMDDVKTVDPITGSRLGGL